PLAKRCTRTPRASRTHRREHKNDHLFAKLRVRHTAQILLLLSSIEFHAKDSFPDERPYFRRVRRKHGRYPREMPTGRCLLFAYYRPRKFFCELPDKMRLKIARSNTCPVSPLKVARQGFGILLR